MFRPRNPFRFGISLRAFGALAVLSLAACTPRAPVATRPFYSYAIVPPREGSWRLKVEATFDGAPSERFIAPEAAGSLRDVALVGTGADGAPLARDRDAWVAPACRGRCTIRYEVDLEALAASCHRLDCDRRVGDAILGRASSFMLRPEPMGDATVRLRADGPDVDRFATGLRRDHDGGYVFAARELGEASFTAFGTMRRGRLDVPGARTRERVDVALLGPPLAMGDAAAEAFIGESASRVAAFFGRFPVDATVFVVPVRGASRVVFGRVLSLAGASVALLFGDATPASSMHDEWVVVHELFHLGTPSFVGEGRWLEEGLATYYEPIIRERAGWMTEVDLWSHFVREMPRGLREAGGPPDLEGRDDIDSTYWGGALFALLADVRIRTATAGARSLDDALRAVLDRDGDATHAARVVDFLRTGDEATGTHELTAVYDSWAVRGENADLAVLWQKLGIEGVEEARANAKRGSERRVILRDDAPLAGVRRAIAASGGF